MKLAHNPSSRIALRHFRCTTTRSMGKQPPSHACLVTAGPSFYHWISQQQTRHSAASTKQKDFPTVSKQNAQNSLTNIPDTSVTPVHNSAASQLNHYATFPSPQQLTLSAPHWPHTSSVF